MSNHVNIVSLDLLIHTPLIYLEDRELCYFPNTNLVLQIRKLIKHVLGLQKVDKKKEVRIKRITIRQSY